MELPAQPDPAHAWRQIQAELRRSLGESMYAVWIEPLELQTIENQRLVLSAPRETQAWLRKRYGRVLERCVRGVLGPEASVGFTDEAASGTPPSSSQRREPAPSALTARFSFEQFIIGDGNHLAHGAALAVAELPGQAYNPLFLHAPPGLGKTHLLHAIGNYVLANGGGASVRYTTAEAFTNHFIAALSTRTLEPFKAAYRHADVLLIDDVQFLASKAKTEEEFFHTFNAVYESGRQLVLSCDRIPSQLEGVAERLRERFGAGLVVDIQPPDFATRVAILRKRVAIDRIPLADLGVLELVAERVSDNVRALEGALIRVVAYHSLTSQPIDTEVTRKVLDGMHYPPRGPSGRLPGGAPAVPSIEAIKAAVACHFGLSVAELVSASRTPRIVWPRQLAIHLARELTQAPLTEIGSAFGGRNHATALHACRRVVQRAAVDKQVAVDIQELTRELRPVGGDRSC